MTRISDKQLARLRDPAVAGRLLPALEGEADVHLVGGAVRDLLLHEPSIDLDLVVVGDAPAVARRVADRLDAKLVVHDRFGTAALRTADGLIADFATARTESYPEPGALPVIKAASLADDLGRRDFTINAMAVDLTDQSFGELHEFPDAGADLQARILRTTHDASFIDDPTRLLRLLRYGARLGFTTEPHTEEMARRAVAAHCMRTVSGPRVRDELLDLMQERGAVVAIDSMRALGLDAELNERFFADEYVAARAYLNAVDGVRQDLLMLAACCRGFERGALLHWVDRLALRGPDREIVVDAALTAAEVADAVAGLERKSEVAELLAAHPPETAALAAALPGVTAAQQERLRGWLAERGARYLLIRGSDLRAAGIPEGPQIGRALAAVSARAIDGDPGDRDQQLAAAVECARELMHGRDRA